MQEEWRYWNEIAAMALLQQGERGGLRFSERIPEFPRFQSDARSPAPSARAACSGMNACSVPRRRGLKGSLYEAERGEWGGGKTLGRRKRREGGVVLKGQRWCELRGFWLAGVFQPHTLSVHRPKSHFISQSTYYCSAWNVIYSRFLANTQCLDLRRRCPVSHFMVFNHLLQSFNVFMEE